MLINIYLEEEKMSDADVKQKVVSAIKAIQKGPRAMRMYMEMCAKCGTCASVCPTGAIDIRHFTDDQIEAQMEALFCEI